MMCNVYVYILILGLKFNEKKLYILYVNTHKLNPSVKIIVLCMYMYINVG